MRWIAMFLLAAGVVGCGSSNSYQVEVTNRTEQPVTLWLTKDGPPAEEGWYAPEELGAIAENDRPSYDLAIVPPGKTGYTGKVSGQFPEGTHAVLRVYDGQKELFHILEDIKAGRSARADHVLKPGNNRLAVVRQMGRLVVEPAE